jgi:ATP-dependent DNA helicase RecQ
MPTGGGKSLCYQLPAALLTRQTAVVISPLIALMQDQVAQLGQMGIPSALLNSSLTPDQQAKVQRDAVKGMYRLLYLSPERLAHPETLSWLKRVPVSLFAIDEAHCISEWGHEFRPEYRQLRRLREQFPDLPIAAFTASATRRVRHDIIEQLQLRDPDRYIASFHRPNLRYLVKQPGGREQSALLLAALRQHSGNNVIVYSPTIARVEQTVDFLEERGIPAIGYHGRMDAATRRNNQERWMSDEVRVLVGTLAFGLGINKTAVRAVIHLSLPKSIEQYYQEAGRAGRDGDPADCMLLWQARDAGLLAHFAGQISDPEEQGRAWERYRQIRGFAESRVCRHRQICTHFGETPKWESCGACDVCSGEPLWLAAAQPQTLSAAELKPLPRPDAPTRPGLEKTSLRVAAEDREASFEIDAALREYLREWRRTVAKELGLPAYVVMHDASLDALCGIRPRSLTELQEVWGFGKHKTQTYGPQILEALKRFRGGARAVATPAKKEKPREETVRLLAEGRSFEEIAALRDRQLRTVVEMVAGLIERGETEFQAGWVEAGKQAIIEAACSRLGVERLRSMKDALPPDISYEEIRLVVARVRWTSRQRELPPGS